MFVHNRSAAYAPSGALPPYTWHMDKHIHCQQQQPRSPAEWKEILSLLPISWHTFSPYNFSFLGRFSYYLGNRGFFIYPPRLFTIPFIFDHRPQPPRFHTKDIRLTVSLWWFDVVTLFAARSFGPTTSLIEWPRIICWQMEAETIMCYIFLEPSLPRSSPPS